MMRCFWLWLGMAHFVLDSSSVHRFITNSAVRWNYEKTLDPKFRKAINLCATSEGKSGKPKALDSAIGCPSPQG